MFYLFYISFLSSLGRRIRVHRRRKSLKTSEGWVEDKKKDFHLIIHENSFCLLRQLKISFKTAKSAKSQISTLKDYRFLCLCHPMIHWGKFIFFQQKNYSGISMERQLSVCFRIIKNCEREKSKVSSFHEKNKNEKGVKSEKNKLFITGNCDNCDMFTWNKFVVCNLLDACRLIRNSQVELPMDC